MAESRWLRHAVRIGGFEFRRSVRAIRQDRARAALMGAGLAVPSLMLFGFVYLFADTIRAAGPVGLPPTARGTVALLWVFGVFTIAQRVVGARPRIDAEELILTTVSTRSAVLGLVIAETLRTLAYLALPTIVLAASVVYLFGATVAVVVIPAASVVLAVGIVVVGMVVGYAVAVAIATIPTVARHKTALGAIAVIVVMGGYLLVTLPQFGAVDQSALAWLPPGWVVDLAVVGTPVRGSLTRAVSIVVGTLLVGVLGVALVEWEASRLWFVDSVSGDEPSADSTTDAGPHGVSALADAIGPLAVPRAIPRPTRRIAEWAILRTRRDPRRLNFLLLPVVMVVTGTVNGAAQSTAVTTILAPVLAVVLPWMAGAAFAMNPLGEEGAMLPVTLLSVRGQTYVRGVMIPGIVFGLPLVVTTTLAGGLVGPYTAMETVGLVASGVVATGVAVATAPAVGMWFPRFSAVSIGQSREIIPPRLLTTALHFAGVTVPAAVLAVDLVEPTLARSVVASLVGYLPALLIQVATGGHPGGLSTTATWFNELGAGIQAVAIETFQLACGGTLVIGGVVVAVLSYRLAIRRFDTYTIEQ